MTDKLTPKDFAPRLLAVLGRLTEFRPDKSVEMTQTFAPVLEAMDLTEDALGTSSNGTTPQTHRQIGLAMRQMRDHGLTTYAKRGYWALTDEGIKEALADAGITPPSDEELAAARADATAEDAETSSGDGGVVVQLTGQRGHPYSDDPYVRSLAADQTPCFGAHSTRSDTCKACPLAAECLRAVDARKAEIAVGLDADEARRAQEAKERAEREAEKDATVDELIAIMPENGSSGGTTGRFGKKGRYKPAADQDIAPAFAQRESTCYQCQEQIPEDSDCTWVQDIGMFHNECVEQ